MGCGIMLGAVALWWIDRHLPHEHFVLGREGTMSTSLRRIWLFVSRSRCTTSPRDLRSASSTARGTSAPPTRSRSASACRTCLRAWRWRSPWWGEDYSRGQAFTVALLTGLVEPVGGLIGVGAVTLIEPLLPWTLAFAAGAMLFVISSEIIPETHRLGFKIEGTFGLMVGFMVMMVLDTTLG
jgi:ZIP family zinc transporter